MMCMSVVQSSILCMRAVHDNVVVHQFWVPLDHPPVRTDDRELQTEVQGSATRTSDSGRCGNHYPRILTSLTNVAYMRHETFSFMMSYLAMSLGDRFHMSRKGGTGGGGWVHPKGANSMTMSELACEKPLVGAG